MAARYAVRRTSRRRLASKPYGLIVRGLDNRPRFERFADAGSYRARLAALEPGRLFAVSIDEVVGWLDAEVTSLSRSDEQ